MSPYQTTTYQIRVTEELLDLKDKINKLSLFQNSTDYTQLDKVDQNLLQEQKMAMIDYADILKLRIARFKE